MRTEDSLVLVIISPNAVVCYIIVFSFAIAAAYASKPDSMNIIYTWTRPDSEVLCSSSSRTTTIAGKWHCGPQSLKCKTSISNFPISLKIDTGCNICSYIHNFASDNTFVCHRSKSTCPFALKCEIHRNRRCLI